MRSAARFQDVIVPFRSLLTMASSDDSTTFARWRWARSGTWLIRPANGSGTSHRSDHSRGPETGRPGRAARAPGRRAALHGERSSTVHAAPCVSDGLPSWPRRATPSSCCRDRPRSRRVRPRRRRPSASAREPAGPACPRPRRRPRPRLPDARRSAASWLMPPSASCDSFSSAAFSSSRFCCSRSAASVWPIALRPRDQRAVGRHLVVLGALAGGNQAGVHRRLVEVLLHDRLAFLDDAGDAVAVLAAHLFVEAREHLLEPLDLALRLLEVGLERLRAAPGDDAAFAIFGSALVSCFSAS